MLSSPSPLIHPEVSIKRLLIDPEMTQRAWSARSRTLARNSTRREEVKANTHLLVRPTVSDLADYLGVPVRTLDRWRQSKSGPPFVMFGRAIRYPEDLLPSA